MSYCTHCGQTIPDTMRCGVKLTPLKARIFDLVRRSGPDGIESAALYDIAFDNTLPKKRTRNTLKAHVWQINEAIDGAGFRICGSGGVYRLTREAAE